MKSDYEIEVQQQKETAWEREEVILRNPEISEHLFPMFEKSFMKLVKAAVKLGVAVPTYTKVREFKKIIEVRKTIDGEIEIFANFFEIQIEGVAPKLAGWKFIAKADYSLDANIPILRAVPNEFVPEEFFNASSTRCDHCNRKHARKTCYVVESETEGFRFVGSTCLKDFLGHASPEQIARFWSFFAFLEEMQNEQNSEGFFRNAPPVWKLEEILQRSACAIRNYGWKSAQQWEDGQTTSGFVSMGMQNVGDLVRGIKNNEMIARIKQEHTALNSITEEDIAEAQSTLEWLANLEAGESGYTNNLINIFKIGFVNRGSLGLAVSSVKVALEKVRSKTKKEEQKELFAESKFVGELGKRQVFVNVKVHNIKSFMGTDFMTGFAVKRFIYTMLTEEGSVLVAFPSSELDCEEGGLISFKATPKKHEVFNGTEQTTVNRIAIL